MATYHSYSTLAAQRIGYADAAILTFLAKWLSKHRTVSRGGKQWISMMRTRLREEFSYMEESNFNKKIARLKRFGYIEIENGDYPNCVYITVTKAGMDLLEGG